MAVGASLTSLTDIVNVFSRSSDGFPLSVLRMTIEYLEGRQPRSVRSLFGVYPTTHFTLFPFPRHLPIWRRFKVERSQSEQVGAADLELAAASADQCVRVRVARVGVDGAEGTHFGSARLVFSNGSGAG